MSAREEVLARVRAALKVEPGRPIPPPPPLRLLIPEQAQEARIGSFTERFEALGGCVHLVQSPHAVKPAVDRILNGRAAIASNAPFLAACGIAPAEDTSKAACAVAPAGITSATYALAETGTLVLLSSSEEQRLTSLLPPAHIAIFPASVILVNLDELFTRIPKPSDQTSALVFITGPSRTGDIEQILVRGVHGPGEIHAIIVATA